MVAQIAVHTGIAPQVLLALDSEMLLTMANVLGER